MFVFECALMKYPNTGLFSFCDNLARSLSSIAAADGDEMGFYVPSRYRGRWGNKVSYRNLHAWHKIYMPKNGTEVWHSAFQRSRYLPSGKVRNVITIHDLNFLYDKPAYKHPRYLRALQHKIDRADRIVAISRFAKKDLSEHIDLRGKDVEVIYNGLNFFDGIVAAPLQMPSRKFLFTIGAVLPKKNFHVLPCLLKDNDMELVIAGIKSGYEQTIMEEAVKWGVADRVSVVGPVPEPVKYWYLQNCSAFMFPSIAEGFGLPVIEAMYFGKPIFLSDHTSLPEIGGSHAFYFDHDFDRNEMRSLFMSKMDLFEKGGPEIELMKEDMKRHAMSFSWDNAAAQYMKIYRELKG